jgi:hypothetical protein
MAAFRNSPRRSSVKRLRQESRADRAGAVENLLLTIRGYHRYRHARLRLAQFGGQIEAASARHVEVQQRDVRSFLFQRFQRLVRVSCLEPGPVGVKRVERSVHRHASELAVVDYQNLVAHRCLHVVLSSAHAETLRYLTAESSLDHSCRRGSRAARCDFEENRLPGALRDRLGREQDLNQRSVRSGARPPIDASLRVSDEDIAATFRRPR